MHLFAILGLFTDRIDRFSSQPFIYFNKWNPYHTIYLKPEKGTPFGLSLPVPCRPLYGVSPPGNWRKNEFINHYQREIKSGFPSLRLVCVYRKSWQLLAKVQEIILGACILRSSDYEYIYFCFKSLSMLRHNFVLTRTRWNVLRKALA